MAPANGEHVAEGPLLFQWTGAPRPAGNRAYRVRIATGADMREVVWERAGIERNRLAADPLLAEGTYYWQVTASNEAGKSAAGNGPAAFTVDASLPNPNLANPGLVTWREDGVVAASPLDGGAAPAWGYLDAARGIEPAADRHGTVGGAVRAAGNGLVRYTVAEFPRGDYTMMLWARPDAEQQPGVVQLFSAWCRPSDDPLRVYLHDGRLHAGVETPDGYTATDAVAVAPDEWHHIAAVRSGDTLTLYLDGQPRASCGVPAAVNRTHALDIALAANPHFPGGEHFTGALDDFIFMARALRAEEVEQAAEDR
jgi:hypothetical protein